MIRSLHMVIWVLLLASCTTPTSDVRSPMPTTTASPQPTTSSAPSAMPTSVASSTPTPTLATAPFQGLNGVRFGANDVSAPAYAAFDSQQGFVYVVDAIDPKLAAPRYQLHKFSSVGTKLTTSSLAIGNRPAPTRVDGVVPNQAGLPVVNTVEGSQFLLVKVAGTTVVAADRYPVHNLAYAQLSASASAENGKYITVGVLHRVDSANSGPVYLSLGRAEEDKASTLLYRLEDPLSSTVRMAISAEGEAFLFGPSKDGKLSVVRIKTDRTVEALPVPLTSIPDYVTVGNAGRLYLAWNGGGQPATVRSVDLQGNWSEEGQLKLASGEYLATVSSVASDSSGRAVITGTGFDAAGKSMKAVFLYSK